MPFLGGFRTVTEKRAFFDQLAANHRDLLEIHEFGDSAARQAGGVSLPTGGVVAGSRLFAARLSNRRVGGNKPATMIVGGLHARELATHYAVERLAQDLLGGWNAGDATSRFLLDHGDIWLVPCANPDGLQVIEIGAQNGRRWLWRKTLGDPLACSFPVTAATGQHSGVDLNRNFATGWGTGGGRAGAAAPCAWTHRGLAASDALEARALGELIQQVFPDPPGAVPEDHPGVLIDLHDPLDSVSWPHAYTAEATPIQAAGLAAFGQAVADAPAPAHRFTRRGQAFSAVYEMGGTLIDFAHRDRGIAALMIEAKAGLLPGLNVAESQYSNRLKPCLIAAASMAEAPYRLARGPRIEGLGEARQHTGGCRISGTATGSAGVAAVAVSVGFPPGSTLATSVDGTPTAGTFSGRSVQFAAMLPPEVYGGDGHTVFIQARGNDGRAGLAKLLRVEPGTAPPPPADTTSGRIVHWQGPRAFDADLVNLGDAGKGVLAPFTLCGWIKPTRTDEGTVIGRRNNNVHQWQLYLYRGKLGLKESDSGRWSSNASLGGNATRPRNGVWQHVGVTVDSAGNPTFYLTSSGGATISEGGSRNGGTFAVRDIDTTAGARFAGAGTGWHFHGEMRDVRVYDRALTGADMAALAAEG